MELSDFSARCLRLLRDNGGPTKVRQLVEIGFSEELSASIRRCWSNCCTAGWAQKGWRGYEITTRGREALAKYDVADRSSGGSRVSG